MSKIIIILGYVFLVYDGDIIEKRKHIHVENKKGRFRTTAKFWLEPEVELASKGNFTDKEINLIAKLIKEHRDLIINQIEKFFKGDTIEIINL